MPDYRGVTGIRHHGNPTSLTPRPTRCKSVALRHGSRPDLAESFFSRMTRQTPRGIRVSSRDEPEERILRHHREADVEPDACRRRWSLSDMGPTIEGLVVDTLLSDGADKAG